MSEFERWNKRYIEGDIPWDTGLPSSELQRVIGEENITPCPAIDLGCGTGSNSIWLAQQGFDVTGVDLSPVAIERARKRAEKAGVRARFLAADVLDSAALAGPYRFFFDRGCYHIVREVDLDGFLRTLQNIIHPGGMGLVLTGNAREPRTGPPVVSEEQIRAELGRIFSIVRLREFRFDVANADEPSHLGWSCLLSKPPLG
jgi:2-polyprenyl-3-methyl-5-hydroxy-6-metoxy-1,4-benzoquinol methylase